MTTLVSGVALNTLSYTHLSSLTVQLNSIPNNFSTKKTSTSLDSSHTLIITLTTQRKETMASPIPIASFGNNSQVAQDIRLKLLPEYDITHICLELEAAQTELPKLFAGDVETNPSSGLGSNANIPATERKVPRALIFGGGVPEEQIKQITEAVLANAPNAKPIHITREEVLKAGGQGPNPDIIAKVLKAKLDEEVGGSDSE